MKKKRCEIFISKHVEGCNIWGNNIIVSDKKKHSIYIELKDKWVIMSKDRKYIAKGVPRDRWIIKVDDMKDKKRIMYYTTKNKAQDAIDSSGFYGWLTKSKEDLEPVEVTITIEEN